jgi:lipoprotein-anchoring transpeptidase ErfK/SrfK
MIKWMVPAILVAGFFLQSCTQTPKPDVAAATAPAKVEAPAADIAALRKQGNTGELRSTRTVAAGFMQPMQTAYLAETQALDEVLAERDVRRKFQPKPEQMPAVVPFSGYEPGTIVIDPQKRVLYLVEDRRSARRYAIAVGRDGLEFKGQAKVGDKQEWPRWFPTKAMQEREPAKYGRYKDGMNGGPDNPLGARAIYLHQDKVDTHIRIHGTNQPETIGSASSNGCFRMVNEHVMDLYNRVRVGAEVVVI